MSQRVSLPVPGQTCSFLDALEMLGRNAVHTQECLLLNEKTARLYPCYCLQLRIATLVCEQPWTLQKTSAGILETLNRAYSNVDAVVRAVVEQASEGMLDREVCPRLFRVEKAMLLWHVRVEWAGRTARELEELHALIRFGAAFPSVPAILPITAAVTRVAHENALYAPVLCAGADGRPAIILHREGMLAATRPEMVFFHLPGSETAKGGSDE